MKTLTDIIGSKRWLAYALLGMAGFGASNMRANIVAALGA